MADRKTLSAVEEAELSKAALYRLGAKLLKNRLPVTIIATFFTAIMAYHALGMQMTTAFNDLLPYRHPFVQVHFKFANQFGGANNVNVMLKVDKGDVFTRDVLKKIYDMTQAMDRVTGVNHDQIASIGHRTTRYLTVLGGTIATPPVMRRPPKTEEEVEEIKKICYNTEAIYGQLVSIDGKALLIKANFVEGRLDYKRIFEEIDRTVKEPFETSEHTIWIAGEPRLYGWIYHYANEVFYIFIAATIFCWLLLYAYFRDWRGALRPTITGATSALWGMGAQALMGFAMDPLALVIPFFITARSVSHSVQMHDRYYEEYHKWNWDKERAIIAAFAELFVPTLSGIITDALGMLAIIVVPVVILQRIAISASIWVASIAISELLLNPSIYYYLKAPEKENVLNRESGPFQRIMNTLATWVVVPRNARLIIIVWVVGALLSLTQLRHLTVGDPSASTPLLRESSPYNLSHLEIQKYFGGIEPLIMVNAYMGYRNVGINLQSLPIVTVGVGFGIDYALYIVSRAVEEYKGDVTEAVRLGVATAGKAVTFTAVTLVMSTTLWAFSNIRFCSEMGLLLALWMAVSFFGSMTFVPAVLVLWKPKFFLRAAEEGIVG